MKRLLLALLATALLAACVPASPDVNTYEDKARLTLQSGVSESRTAQKVLESLYDDRIMRLSAKTQLRYSEGALDTASKAFTELNPPPSRDWLDKATSTLLTIASDLLAEARVAIERDEAQQYPGIARDLSKVATKMEKLEGRVS